MSRGLSILIPVYNFAINDLVTTLQKQAANIEGLDHEILCYDDGSSTDICNKNSEVAQLNNVVYKKNPTNKGRSKTRNELAREAKHPLLLFLDCDSEIVKNDFISKYLEAAIKAKVIIGGTVYDKTAPDPTTSLRWKYGKAREERSAADRMRNPYRSITINNLLIDKQTYLDHQLDEAIATYGHEDTKFGYELKQNAVPLLHINNPVKHIGLEPNQLFLDKTAEAIKNFYHLTRNEHVGRDTRLYIFYNFHRKVGLRWLFHLFYFPFKGLIKQNLLSKHPSLFAFDLFKLNLLMKEK